MAMRCIHLMTRVTSRRDGVSFRVEPRGSGLYSISLDIDRDCNVCWWNIVAVGFYTRVGSGTAVNSESSLRQAISN